MKLTPLNNSINKNKDEREEEEEREWTKKEDKEDRKDKCDDAVQPLLPDSQKRNKSKCYSFRKNSTT